MQQAQEALGIAERLGDTGRQADCLIGLAWALETDKQLDAAEKAASRAISILPEEGEQHRVCRSHQTLGEIYRSKGETEKAIDHFEVSLGIASSFNWHERLFLVHYSMVILFRDEGRLDDAQVHVDHAKLHTVNNAYHLGSATEEQASICYKQHRLEEARSEALRAADIYDKLGAGKDLENCRMLLRDIEKGLNTPITSGQSGFDCELLQAVLLFACIDSSF